jgi:hypothetical protein
MSRIKFIIRDRSHEIEFVDGGRPIFVFIVVLGERYKNARKPLPALKS